MLPFLRPRPPFTNAEREKLNRDDREMAEIESKEKKMYEREYWSRGDFIAEIGEGSRKSSDDPKESHLRKIGEEQYKLKMELHFLERAITTEEACKRIIRYIKSHEEPFCKGYNRINIWLKSPGCDDVGTFTRDDFDSPGFEILSSDYNKEKYSKNEVQAIIASILENNIKQYGKMNRESMLASCDASKIIPLPGFQIYSNIEANFNIEKSLKSVREYLESEFIKDNNSSTDFQKRIGESELIQMIGQEGVDGLKKLFGDTVDEIVLRRVAATGCNINFHTDYSLKTLQLALNGDYQGGELVFLTNEGKVEQPMRREGTITIHNNRIVHGVKKFIGGVRYSLFFLNKNEKGN